ncbi:MAG: hypothetical protein AAF513_16435 [Pseudomonadota bacterium]
MTTQFPQALQPLNNLLEPLIRLGFAAPLNLTPGLVVLEVRGRKSGRLRSLPLVAYLAYPYVVLGTVRSASQWIKNLQAESEPHIWIWGRRFALHKEFVSEHVIAGRLAHAVPGHE